VIGAALGALDRLVATGCRWIVTGCFAGLFVLLSAGILQRLLPFIRIPGYDELVELLFAWMVFAGALALWREGTLYRVDLIERLLPAAGRRALSIVAQAAMLAIAWLLAWKGADFAIQAGETTPFLQANKISWYAAIPVCGALMVCYSLAALWRAILGRDTTGGPGSQGLG
jgi:TRAP-type C4-dicarboxylate transport system permease small subunit